VGALGLAAVFAAEVSSADAVLFMLATSLSQDLYRGFLRPGASDAQLLRVARGAALAGGLAGTALAIVIPTVVLALTVFYGLLTVMFFVPVVAALASRRVGAPEALAGMGTGVAVLAAVHLATAGAGLWGWRPDTIALGASGLAFAAMWTVRRP